MSSPASVLGFRDVLRTPAVKRLWIAQIVSIFGDITRSGSWPPGQRTSPFSLFGDIDLDLRQASIPEGDVVFAQVAPGNAASLRAFLAAGFRPIGSEVLFLTS